MNPADHSSAGRIQFASLEGSCPPTVSPWSGFEADWSQRHHSGCSGQAHREAGCQSLWTSVETSARRSV